MPGGGGGGGGFGYSQSPKIPRRDRLSVVHQELRALTTDDVVTKLGSLVTDTAMRIQGFDNTQVNLEATPIFDEIARKAGGNPLEQGVQDA